MGIRLMPHIEQKLVMGAIEQTVACQRKLDHTEARGDMPAILGGGQKNLFANLGGKNAKLLIGKELEISRR